MAPMHDGIDNAKCSPENKEIVRNALHERTIRLLNASKESSAPSHLSNGPNEKEEADERRPSQGSQTKARKKGSEKKGNVCANQSLYVNYRNFNLSHWISSCPHQQLKICWRKKAVRGHQHFSSICNYRSAITIESHCLFASLQSCCWWWPLAGPEHNYSMRQLKLTELSCWEKKEVLLQTE